MPNHARAQATVKAALRAHHFLHQAEIDWRGVCDIRRGSEQNS
jgi:hypothetical protein